jgi:2-phospho-L-lactate/phosphoenolpyruvate guanylyltransferase
MRTLAVVPVKSFDRAKQRLAGALTGTARTALAQAMLADVLAALARAERVEAIAVVTADAAARRAAARAGAGVLHDAREASQSAAAEVGIRHAAAAGFDAVVLIPGDTPLLDPAELDALLERAGSDGLAVAIVPDRHGEGTNALAISPPDALAPAFGPGSRARHEAAARAAGAEVRLAHPPSLVLDVDTVEDLDALRAALRVRTGGAAHTRGLLARLERR